MKPTVGTVNLLTRVHRQSRIICIFSMVVFIYLQLLFDSSYPSARFSHEALGQRKGQCMHLVYWQVDFDQGHTKNIYIYVYQIYIKDMLAVKRDTWFLLNVWKDRRAVENRSFMCKQVLENMDNATVFSTGHNKTIAYYRPCY